MSAKRLASSDLNHTNWDKDEEPEDKGVFKSATAEELQSRVIRKARRKLAGTNNEGEETPSKSVFSGFSGFGKSVTSASTVSATGSPFSFLSKLTSTTSSSSKADDTDKGVDASSSSSGNEKSSTNNNYFDKSDSYYAKLKGLNQAVSNWIKTHVDQNPLCILTPIFQDYEKYLKELEMAKESSVKVSTSENLTKSNAMGNFKFTSTTNTMATSPSFSFTMEKKTEENKGKSSEPLKTGMFGSPGKFGANSTYSSGFSFGTKSDEKPTTSDFSFSSAKPFSFGSAVVHTTESKQNENEEDEDDSPPKVEVNVVVEDDSVYSKKCKVFVKHDGNYSDRGVGTLHLKPVKDSEKTQLIVRADTNLGNILVNLILNEAIPTQRLGKNNVMMVCIPTPESEQKPTSILLRVKTSEDADELLDTIKKYKK